jgi:hypothetical protein
MTEFAVRLLTLAIYAAALVVLPAITPANAASTQGKHARKHAKATQRAPAVRDASRNPFTSNRGEDFDRKNTSGGGY